jgi:hypothetical protein
MELAHRISWEKEPIRMSRQALYGSEGDRAGVQMNCFAMPIDLPLPGKPYPHRTIMSDCPGHSGWQGIGHWMPDKDSNLD